LLFDSKIIHLEQARFSILSILNLKPMNFKEVLTRLYFILICSDGNVNEKEVSYGRKMVEAEGIDEKYFFSQIKILEVNNQHELLPEAIAGIKKLSRQDQIRCLVVCHRQFRWFYG
jgi:hypothetical protein